MCKLYLFDVHCQRSIKPEKACPNPFKFTMRLNFIATANELILPTLPLALIGQLLASSDLILFNVDANFLGAFYHNSKTATNYHVKFKYHNW